MSDGSNQEERALNLSSPARYSGEAGDQARVEPLGDANDDTYGRFTEILLNTADIEWAEKTLEGLSHKMLWRNDETGASIALVRFEKGSGIPSRHAHASNQFMFCLKGRYRYLPSEITLTEGSFYWNPAGCTHGPTVAEEESILFEVYDGPHYPTQPDWYTSPSDAR